MNVKSITSYLEPPFHIEVVRSASQDGDAGWVVEVEELRGCIAQGRSHEKLRQNIGRAVEAWIEDALQAGDAIPAPR